MTYPLRELFEEAINVGGVHADVLIRKPSKDRLVLKAAGYKLQGKIRWNGLEIAIENRKGSVRRGVSEDGKPWQTKMLWPYGGIRNTSGFTADSDCLDVFVGPHEDSRQVFVIHQQDPKTRRFDEDKVMLGWYDWPSARDAYLAHYDDQRFLPADEKRAYTAMSLEQFKARIKDRQENARHREKEGRPPRRGMLKAVLKAGSTKSNLELSSNIRKALVPLTSDLLLRLLERGEAGHVLAPGVLEPMRKACLRDGILPPDWLMKGVDRTRLVLKPSSKNPRVRRWQDPGQDAGGEAQKASGVMHTQQQLLQIPKGKRQVVNGVAIDHHEGNRGYTVWVDMPPYGKVARAFPNAETLAAFMDGTILGLHFYVPETEDRVLPVVEKSRQYQGPDEPWTERKTGEEVLDTPLLGWHYGGHRTEFVAKQTCFYREFKRNYVDFGYLVIVPPGKRVSYYDDEFRVDLDSDVLIFPLKGGWNRFKIRLPGQDGKYVGHTQSPHGESWDYDVSNELVGKARDEYQRMIARSSKKEAAPHDPS